MRERHTPPPLPKMVGFCTAFYLIIRCLSVMFSPLERGFKGCVTVRGAARDGMLR